MHYSILIYESPEAFALRSDPAKQQDYWKGWTLYTKALKDAGIFVAGAGLEPPTTATTLKFDHGKHAVQDGPFADSKEQLGGFYVIEAPNLDTALEWAQKGPFTPGYRVEIRPNLVPRTPPA